MYENEAGPLPWTEGQRILGKIGGFTAIGTLIVVLIFVSLSDTGWGMGLYSLESGWSAMVWDGLGVLLTASTFFFVGIIGCKSLDTPPPGR